MLTHEDVIQMKCNCFKAGIFDVLDLLPKQEEAMKILTNHSVSELLYGGAKGGAKSWLGCEWLLWSCLSYPETRWYVGRHFLKQIRESTLVTFRKVCKKHHIPVSFFHINENEVTIKFSNGSFIGGIELRHKPSDAEYDGFGSTEYTGGWIEEGGGVAYKAYEIGRMSIGRHLNKEYGIYGKLFITANPARNWMYSIFYRPWSLGNLLPGRVFIQAFVTDNTKVDAGYKERLEGLTGSARERLLLGNWDYEDDPLALIEYDAIVDLFTNDYLRTDETKKRLVIDAAMYGSDLFRMGVFYGDVLVDHTWMPKSGGKEIITKAKGLQAKHGIRASNILYDADGVGAFIGNKGGFIPGAVAFHGNASPLKRKYDKVTDYANLKAQCGYALASDLNEGKMWARAVTDEKDREMLSEELAQIKRGKVDTDEKLTLMKKELIVEALGRSPDFSDLFLMSRYFKIVESLKRPAHERPLH